VSGIAPLSGDLKSKYDESMQKMGATISRLVDFLKGLSSTEKQTALSSKEVIDLLRTLTLPEIATYQSIIPPNEKLLCQAIAEIATVLSANANRLEKESMEKIRTSGSLTDFILNPIFNTKESFERLRAIFPGQTAHLAERFFHGSRNFDTKLAMLSHLADPDTQSRLLKVLISRADSAQHLEALQNFIDKNPQVEACRGELINKGLGLGLTLAHREARLTTRLTNSGSQQVKGVQQSQPTLDEIKGSIQRLVQGFLNIQNPETTSTKKIQQLFDGFENKDDSEKRAVLNKVGQVLDEAKGRDNRWFTRYLGLGKRSEKAEALYVQIRQELAKIPDSQAPASSKSRMMGATPQGLAQGMDKPRGLDPHSPAAGA
jgi:hypothetical protein